MQTAISGPKLNYCHLKSLLKSVCFTGSTDSRMTSIALVEWNVTAKGTEGFSNRQIGDTTLRDVSATYLSSERSTSKKNQILHRKT